MPRFILIHAAVWPQYTNVTDKPNRQDRTDRQTVRQTDRKMVRQHRANPFTNGCPKTRDELTSSAVVLELQISTSSVSSSRIFAPFWYMYTERTTRSKSAEHFNNQTEVKMLNSTDM